MDKKLKDIRRLAGLVVFNTKKPAYVHYDDRTLKFIVSTKSTYNDYLLIEKVTEEIVPCVEVRVLSRVPVERKWNASDS